MIHDNIVGFVPKMQEQFNIRALLISYLINWKNYTIIIKFIKSLQILTNFRKLKKYCHVTKTFSNFPY